MLGLTMCVTTHSFSSSTVSAPQPYSTSNPLGVPAARRTSSDSTSTCRPNRSAISPISAGRAIAAVFTPTLSAPARSRVSTSDTERTPPPTVSGMNTDSAVRRTTSSIVPRSSDDAVTSRNVNSSAPAAS